MCLSNPCHLNIWCRIRKALTFLKERFQIWTLSQLLRTYTKHKKYISCFHEKKSACKELNVYGPWAAIILLVTMKQNSVILTNNRVRMSGIHQLQNPQHTMFPWKQEDYHVEGFVITGCTWSCHSDKQVRAKTDMVGPHEPHMELENFAHSHSFG